MPQRQFNVYVHLGYSKPRSNTTLQPCKLSLYCRAACQNSLQLLLLLVRSQPALLCKLWQYDGGSGGALPCLPGLCVASCTEHACPWCCAEPSRRPALILTLNQADWFSLHRRSAIQTIKMSAEAR